MNHLRTLIIVVLAMTSCFSFSKKIEDDKTIDTDNTIEVNNSTDVIETSNEADIIEKSGPAEIPAETINDQSVYAVDDLKTKQLVCDSILNDLKIAKGLVPGSAPFLHVVEDLADYQPSKGRVLKMAIAWNDGNIYLDAVTYDICKEYMGADWKNGLAFILAHELGHFTRKHHVRHQFVSEANDMSVMDAEVKSKITVDVDSEDLESLEKAYKAVESKYRIRENEAEADLEAGFTSYLAGYKSIEAGPKFLDLSYRAFKIDTTGGNYVSKAQRKEIVINTGRKLDTLIQVFEAGNYATAIGDYATALECYNYVSEDYQSVQIFNNMGLLGIMESIDSLSFADVKYLLPITMEMKLSGVQTGGTKGGEKSAIQIAYERKVGALKNSIRYFNKALEMDPHYYLPALNKSIAYYLIDVVKRDTVFKEVVQFKGDDLLFAETAALTAKQNAMLLKKNNEKALHDVYNMLAILNHELNRPDQASRYVLKYQSLLKNKTGDINALLISGNEAQVLKDSINSISNYNYCEKLEFIHDNGKRNTITNLIKAHNTNKNGKKWDAILPIKKVINGPDVLYSELKIARTKDYTLYHYLKRNQHNVPKRELYLCRISKDYSNPTICDISKGSDISDLLNKDEYYGNPSRQIQSSTGSLLRYISKENQGIVFTVSKNKVRDWLVFATPK